VIGAMCGVAAILHCCRQHWFESYSVLDVFWMVSGSFAKLLWIRAVPINDSYLYIFCYHAKAI
jgi:hypothetical protein